MARSSPTWLLALQSIAFLAAAIGVGFAARQVRHNRASREASALQFVVSTQQGNEARNDRKLIYDTVEAAEREGVAVEWTPEGLAAIERVCQNFDVTAILVREGAIREGAVLRHWGRSVRRLWPICEPVVNDLRANRANNDRWLFSGFEWLAQRAHAHRPRPFDL